MFGVLLGAVRAAGGHPLAAFIKRQSRAHVGDLGVKPFSGFDGPRGFSSNLETILYPRFQQYRRGSDCTWCGGGDG